MSNFENVNNTFKELFKITKAFPIILGIAYFLGFVIINAFLSKYNFSDNNLISVKYLISGFCFLLFVSPSVFLVYFNYAHPTDNLKENWQEWLDIIRILLYYALFIDLLTIDFHGITELWRMYFPLFAFFLIYMFDFYLTSYAARNIKPLRKCLIMLVLLIIYHFCAIIFLPIIIFIKTIIIATGIITLIIMGLTGDKNLNLSYFSTLTITLAIGAAFFGLYAYDKIPKHLGGGKSTQVICYINNEKEKSFKGLNFHIENQTFFKCKILYYSDDKYYIENDEGYFVIKSELIEAIQTLKKN